MRKALLLASGALAALAAAAVLALRRRRLRAKPPAAPKKIAPKLVLDPPTPTRSFTPTPPSTPEDGDDDGASLFAALPHEAQLHVLLQLPPGALLRCERVCHAWRAAVAQLPLWAEWRNRPAVFDESPLAIPGMSAPAFGSPPADLTAEEAEAAAEAAASAARLPRASMALGACGAHWTVLAMASADADADADAAADADADADGDEPPPPPPPKALRQLCSHDYLVALSADSDVVVSGDKDSQLRLWDARSGRLRRRVAFSGSVTALDLGAGGVLLVGDAVGHVTCIDVAELLRGRLNSFSWRAHEGKAGAARSLPHADIVVTGGADGCVRRWSLRRLRAMAAEAVVNADESVDDPDDDGFVLHHDTGVGVSGGRPMLRASSSRVVELGLEPCSGARTLARHGDSVTHLALDGRLAVSGSRDGVVRVSDTVAGVALLTLPRVGQLNCLACHREKLLLCADDGHHATLEVWDLRKRTRVQQLGGIRKWNAPTSIAYFGYSSAWWVRDLNLCTLRFAAEEEADG